MRPVNWTCLVSEISPRLATLSFKKFPCIHMRNWAGPVSEISVIGMKFPHMNTTAWVTGTKLFRQNSFAFAT